MSDKPARHTASSAGNFPTDDPLKLDNTTMRWDDECDVLVVGFGAAGASTAITAAENGAKVMVAERFQGGGASTMSGGVVYAGGGTDQQRALGYNDTPEAMFNYLRQETGDAVSEATLRRFCNDSTGLIKWLESIGADFTSTEPPPKTSYPKDGIYLYYSGNETVPEYAAHAKPAPRGHRTRGNWMSGKVLFDLLSKRSAQLGVVVHRQTAAKRLVVDDNGAILGVEFSRMAPGSKAAIKHQKLFQKAEKAHLMSPRKADRIRQKAVELEARHAETIKIKARNGVVLSTGGFIFNREMVHNFAPKFKTTLRLGATGCDGSGIRLGASVGGVPDRMHKVSAWRFINPPTPWPHGMVVDAKGQRFCNEQVYGAKLGVEMCENHEGRAWIIIDKKLRRRALKECLFGGLWFFQSVPALILMLRAPRARRIEDLAKRIGVPADALEQSLARYNQGARCGKDALGKHPDFLSPMDRGPYYALDISPLNRMFPCPSITLGGLKVNEADGSVVNANGQSIPGLYAAGRCAVGIASNGYISGLSIADCLWSGRRAGSAAAAVGAQASAA